MQTFSLSWLGLFILTRQAEIEGQAYLAPDCYSFLHLYPGISDLLVEKSIQQIHNMNTMNPKVDFFFTKDTKWRQAYEKLRTIVLDCGLTEELKWGVPCYTFQNRNVVLIHGFKDYCALLFHKGTLLSDTNGLLIQQTAQVQAARQIRFTDVREIVEKEALLKAYIYEAIEVEKAGLKVAFKEMKEYEIPEEFQQRLDENEVLKAAFERLTPGRQKGYLLHFSQPKQSKTRVSRIEKHLEKILNGKGLND